MERTFEFFCKRLVEQNIVTGNFLALLEQTVSRLRQMINRRIAPSQQNIEQCCCAIQLSCLIMSYFCSHLSPKQVKKENFFPKSLYKIQFDDSISKRLDTSPIRSH